MEGWENDLDNAVLRMLGHDDTIPIPASQTPYQSLDLPSPGLGSMLEQPSHLPDLQCQEDRALLHHFHANVAAVLSKRSVAAAEQDNPFVQHLLPMALASDAVLHAVLALSAGQWERLQPTMTERAPLHSARATVLLSELLQSMDGTNAEVATMVCLLLCAKEVYDGTSTGWKHHLQGAKRLLRTMKFNLVGGLLSRRCRFMVSWYRYLDSAVTISTCRPPSITQVETVASVNRVDSDAFDIESIAMAPDEEDTAIYGIPKALFHLVDRVNMLACKRKSRTNEMAEAEFREVAEHVATLIENWNVDCGSYVSTPTYKDKDMHHATRAYETALRLRLHQILEGYDNSSDVVKDSVASMLRLVEQVRRGSAVEGCLLFPLVMAGGACSQWEERLVIQDRLMVMERTIGFGQIYRARELVEKVWKRRDQCHQDGVIANWARIRFEEMSGLTVC